MIKNYKKVFMFFIIITVIYLNVGTLADILNKDKAFNKVFNKVASKTCEDMKNFQKTEDVRMNYLNICININESSKKLSETILKYTENKEIESIAKSLSKSQDESIKIAKENIKILSKNKKIEKEKEEYIRIYECIAKKLCNKIIKTKESKTNIDKKYIYTSIIFNEEIINLSRNILDFTKDKRIIEFSEEIIQKKELELEMLREILNNLGE